MKIAKRPQAYRIRRILEMIRAGKRGGGFPNARDFSSELGVSWPTIMRDLDCLRDDEGAPIEYDASRKGYFLADGGWTLKPVTLNQREVFAFSMAAKMMEPFRGTPLEMDLQSLFAKIARSLEGTVTLSVDALTDQFSVISDDHVPLDPEVWVKAAGLIERRKYIKARYRKFSGEVNMYELFPVHLAAYHGNWYLMAFAGVESKLRTFALSRFLTMSPTGRTRALPEGFNLQQHMWSAFGITQGDREMDVRLLFSKKIATYIEERQWHPSQKMIRRKNGSVELRMKTRGWKELVRWILSWQPDVKVLAPLDLRARVQQKLREGLAVYPSP